MDSLTRLIGERVRIAREDANLTQAKLTEALAFEDRQTLSAIENGQRRVSAEELLRFSQVLDRPLDYFTDPYIVAGQKAFSYRSMSATEEEIADFEKQASSYIATHRRFQGLLDQAASPAQPQISRITKGDSLTLATSIGEQCAAAWKLGATPAKKLQRAACEKLGITVFYVDAPQSISGAACRLNDGAYVLINRNEASTRQNFDLGHEIFHLLTWDRLPPERLDIVIDDASPAKKPKVEKLADAFTAGLLMPAPTVKAYWDKRGDTERCDWILNTADDLGVSPIALYWRIVNLGLVKNDDETLAEAKTLRSRTTEPRPQLFSSKFVKDLYEILERGFITVRKAQSLLDMDQEELEELFHSYKHKLPFDL